MTYREWMQYDPETQQIKRRQNLGRVALVIAILLGFGLVFATSVLGSWVIFWMLSGRGAEGMM